MAHELIERSRELARLHGPIGLAQLAASQEAENAALKSSLADAEKRAALAEAGRAVMEAALQEIKLVGVPPTVKAVCMMDRYEKAYFSGAGAARNLAEKALSSSGSDLLLAVREVWYRAHSLERALGIAIRTDAPLGPILAGLAEIQSKLSRWAGER